MPEDGLAPVDVERIELVRLSMPLVTPFRTSFGVESVREVLLVHVLAEDVSGWGESVAPREPLYSEEYLDGVAHVLEHHLVPRLLAHGPLVGHLDVRDRLVDVRGHRMARAALECAILDAQLRAARRSLVGFLGATRRRIPVGVSVGIPDGGVPELLERITGYLDDGYLRVKAKIAPGFDVEPMQAVRGHFGSDLALQVDANAAYDPDDSGHLAALDALDELGMVQIEQPFGADRIRDHTRVASRLRTPICLDESVVDARRARDVIESGACGIVNVKVGRVGGVLEAVAVHDVCAERNVPVWCGGMLETGIGRAVNAAVAALPGFELPGDVSASDRYYTTDLTEEFVLDAGHIAVPDTPGIGREPRGRMLADARRRALPLP